MANSNDAVQNAEIYWLISVFGFAYCIRYRFNDTTHSGINVVSWEILIN